MGNAADNAYHVVVCAGALGLATLDGFTITGGNANGTISDNITLNSQTISKGSAGGVYNTDASPTFTNVIISGNTASYFWGGMLNLGNSSPSLTNCVVSGNTALGTITSGATAYKELRDAMVPSNLACGATIYIAKGTFKPTPNNRDSAFTILNSGVKLLGGYPSGGGLRSPMANPVYLDGDIGTVGDSTDNSYHIMVIAGADASTDSLQLDGLNFSHGNANDNGSYSHKLYNGISVARYKGGGLSVTNNGKGTKFAIRQCRFISNTASSGGGINIESSNLAGSYTVFAGNNTGSAGSVIQALYTPLLVNDCIFPGNKGSAFFSTNAFVINSSCFSGNLTDASDAAIVLFNPNAGPIPTATVNNCILWGNTTSYYTYQGKITMKKSILDVAVKLGEGTLITIFPNPTKNFVWLHGGSIGLIGTDACITDMQGRVISRNRITQWP